MYRAYKFRLYPDKKQKNLLARSFGSTRFIHNYYLNKINENGYINSYNMINDYVNNLKYQYPFLQEIDSILIRKELFYLDDSFKKYYNLGYGYPKYKSKNSKESYTTNAIYRTYKDKKYCNIELDLTKRLIKLPKLKWVKIRGYRNINNIDGRIINATISKEINGKYYVSVVYEISNSLINNIIPKSIVGLDLGIKNLITLSDGEVIENNKYIEKYEKRIARLNRQLARKKKNSKNFNKCKQKLRILYNKLRNARKYYIHNITKKITDNYDVIVAEKLKTKEMITKKEISKEISDASFYEILRQLKYKTKYKGKYFYQIDTYYPSSQTCSVCGNIDKKYKDLTKREYRCKCCNNLMDRDFNAGVNIMFEGLKLYMNEVLI